MLLAPFFRNNYTAFNEGYCFLIKGGFIMNETKKAVIKEIVSDAVTVAGGVCLIHAGTVTSKVVPVPVRMGIELLGAAETVLGGCWLVDDVQGLLKKVTIVK